MKELIKKLLRENIESDKYFSNIGLKTSDVFKMIDYHDSYKNLYPEFDEWDNEFENDYYFNSKEDAYNEVNEILEFFNDFPQTIEIYRTIKVKSIDDIDYSWLGDSWSYKKESAINFARNHAGGNVLLIGKTDRDNVDWALTVELYFKFSREYQPSESEDELNIIDSEKIFDTQAIKLTKNNL